MTKYREILRLHSLGISQRSIASSCECSRNTVAKVLYQAGELDLSWPLPDGTTDGDLAKKLFPKPTVANVRKKPDLEHLHKELAKQGVTLKLLWSEYCEECRREKSIPLMYSQFCNLYQKFARKKRASMHIPRKPGEQTEVDWAGQTVFITDSNTGEKVPASVFVGVLSYSHYAYVEAFFKRDLESWITAHAHMFQFFGGATRIIVPDNLKTGVSKPDWYSPTINTMYHEMAEHYNTAIIPARIRKPKDKPSVEGAVGAISTWVLAALRNRQFFSLHELNRAIRTKLVEFNKRPFQKKAGSRLSFFLEQEKQMLLPLPAAPFEPAIWKQATVQFNYHISIEKNHYSVPYEYIKHKVDVRITHRVIEVFYKHTRICSHARLYGRIGQYSTNEAHMPDSHKKYLSWNAERFITWAEKIGPSTMITVKAILSSHKIEQQGYRSCMGLLRLVDKYSISRVETACKKALSYTPQPSYKNVKTILSTGQDKVVTTHTQPTADCSPHGFSRDAAYYGRE